MTKAATSRIEMVVRNFRLYLKHRRPWATWLIAAALLMKVIVPAGYMPVISDGAIAIQLCSGFGPEMMAMAMPGMGDHHGEIDHSGKGDMPCGFAGHAPAAIAGADPILLIAAIAFIIATLFRMPLFRPVRRIGYLRPYLRGPPAISRLQALSRVRRVEPAGARPR